MALIIIDAKQADKFGLAEPIKDPKAAYDKYVKEVAGSETAKKLVEALGTSKKKIGVLLIDDGFDSMFIPPYKIGAPEFDGGVAVVNVKSIMKISGKAIPIGVSLMHELGHAKQCADDQKWFEKRFMECMGEKQPGKGLTKLMEATKKPASKAAQLDIENKNLAAHETPICKELKLPHRDTYD